jgi:hypothetical protein
MENAGSYQFEEGVEFPSIPQEKIPEDSHALRRILAGQRGLQRLYADLDGVIKGEAHCLTMLLRRDWERHFKGLLESGESALRLVGYNGDSEETLPLPDQIQKIVKSLEGCTPEEALAVVSAFASKALLCYQMVPWVSNVKEVFEHFKACVEAEDHHLAMLQMFEELLEPTTTG